MAIRELSSEQVRTWSLEQKDRWWRAHVFRGDAPQLTVRAAVTGMVLGGLLSLTNLYVGIRTGWTLGVGITSVILAFAAFKVLSKVGWGTEISVLENNAMQSVATAAGYMTGPLISSMPAYMLVTGRIVPPWETAAWIVSLSVLGVLVAFPLKRRYINDEQLPFPEGRAAGIVMDSLHSSDGAEGVFKAKLLAGAALVSGVVELLRSERLWELLRVPFVAIPHYWDAVVYRWFTPTVMGTPLKDLTVRLDSSLVMVAAGGLMGWRTGVSLLVGAVVNYLVLAPLLVARGVIAAASFKSITMWSLWGGVAMMTAASLVAFFSRPQVIVSAFSGLLGRRRARSDVLRDVELPMGVFAVGIPLVGAVCVYLGHRFFGVEWWLGVVAIVLVFAFTVIAVNSTGLTSITPTGALGKLTQLSFSVLAPGNITTNLMTASITGEVAGNASNLLMDIKPGYMLGAKPRHQAVGHVLGIAAGAAASIPVFYAIVGDDLSRLTSVEMPMPSAQVWKAVAEMLTQGLSLLHPSAQAAIVVGAVLGVAFEVAGRRWPRFPLSGVGVGLAFVLPFSDALSMAIGAVAMAVLRARSWPAGSWRDKVFARNAETLCAGGIAGGALVGLLVIVLESM